MGSPSSVGRWSLPSIWCKAVLTRYGLSLTNHLPRERRKKAGVTKPTVIVGRTELVNWLQVLRVHLFSSPGDSA